MSTDLFSISLTVDQLRLLVSILEEQMRRCGAAYELTKLINGFCSGSQKLIEVFKILFGSDCIVCFNVF